MRIEANIEDEYVNDLVQEAWEKIVKKLSPDGIERIIRGKVIQIAEAAISDCLADKKQEIEKLCIKRLNENIFVEMDSIIDCLARETENRGTKKAVRDAISEVIYKEKDIIVKEVVERASKHVATKAKMEMAKKLMEGFE